MYGTLDRVIDPEGNKVELWQPPDGQPLGQPIRDLPALPRALDRGGTRQGGVGRGQLADRSITHGTSTGCRPQLHTFGISGQEYR